LGIENFILNQSAFVRDKDTSLGTKAVAALTRRFSGNSFRQKLPETEREQRILAIQKVFPSKRKSLKQASLLRSVGMQRRDHLTGIMRSFGFQ